MEFRCVIFYGPPGVGKGTQAEVTRDNFNMEHISTGNLLRDEIQAGSELGRQVEKIVKSGGLVTDETVNVLVKKKIETGFPDINSFLFDGYPRTLSQARSLDAMLESLGLSVHRVINFYANRAELLRRLTGRRMCANCGANYHTHNNPPRINGICDRCKGPIIQRADDNVESVSRRLDNFERATRPLLEYYRERGLQVDVDAMGQIYDVQERVRRAIEEDPIQTTDHLA